MKMKVLGCIITLLALALLVAGCVTEEVPVTPPNGVQSEVGIMYTAVGQMPMLLSTGQVDGFMVWQPLVSVATVSGIGTVVSYSQDLPPEGTWKDHTCCALSAREDFIAAHPDVANAFAALFILAGDYVQNNPERTAGISANWLYGGADMTFGDVTISSHDVLKDSIPTIRFTTEHSPEWLESNDEFILALRDIGYLTGSLKDASKEEVRGMLFDFAPYEAGRAMIDAGEIVTPAKLTKPISLGYLPSDHDAPLFVAVKEWQYFNDEYGIALKPRSDVPGKVEVADLIVNGVTVAEVRLVLGEGGAPLMTLMSTDAIQMAYAGTPPAINAIDKGTPIKILFPTQTEGSGFVVAASAPVTDWNSFITWVEKRSAEGKPVKIASPARGSIQDVQIKYALQESGVVVKEV
ncbi:ABC transporter substrate-binding protein [Methanocalculus sp.]|uniref:ABC transporter substrate-binding protein n=1 Tax=Methanocalculus sp. TaxID=2004547 RepID=UPI0026230401|nr:ABC transporter substrate-binding protein [Methanocalculus sp.]MDG6250300.1 ABC transporter substrate-binding protein [Methanocalculus sp.]